MSLVSAAIDVELVEVTDEGVVGAGLRRILGIEVDPLFLQRLELGQVVEVDPAFTRVASKEENAVLKGEAMSARAWSWLVLITSLVEFHDFLPVVCN